MTLLDEVLESPPAAPRLRAVVGVPPRVRRARPRPLRALVVAGRPRTGSRVAGKRVFDLVVGIVLLALSIPVLAIAAVAIKLSDRGPVLYRQRRVGRGGREFEMLKLRSMAVGADQMVADLAPYNIADGLLFKVHADPRVTPVGRALRRLSIDELPQLWNVIRGDMSLVGPRPLPVDPSAFGPFDGRRHVVRPGITGPWQVTGGTALTYAEMVKLDLCYIQQWSLRLDLALLLRTVPALWVRARVQPC